MEMRNRKLEGLRALLRRREASGILVTTTANFAWLTGGMWNGVRNTSEVGASFLLVTNDGCFAIANNIEAPRIEAEELAGSGWTIDRFAWHEKSPLDVARTRAGSGPVLSDSGIFDTVNVESEVAPLRWTLDEDECRRMRQAGALAGEAVAAAAMAVRPGMTEYEAAALLAREVMARGGFPSVTLVGADERIRLYRHPVATAKRMARCVMLVLGARLSGVTACCTRIVHFGPVPADLGRRHEAVCRVDAALIQSTTPGATLGRCFAAAQTAYAAEGFAEEWKHHHQGGVIGYQTRETLAKPGSPTQVVPPQAFAWNPTIAGTKSEDTILLANGECTVLTVSRDWPLLSVDTGRGRVDRPDILVA